MWSAGVLKARTGRTGCIKYWYCARYEENNFCEISIDCFPFLLYESVKTYFACFLHRFYYHK